MKKKEKISNLNENDKYENFNVEIFMNVALPIFSNSEATLEKYREISLAASTATGEPDRVKTNKNEKYQGDHCYTQFNSLHLS